MNRPLVSVVIPTYNRRETVLNAINSILSQSYENVEVIVVDDHSTDQTEEAISLLNDSRISYIRHKENRGAPVARNTGIKHSKGKYIGFLDSDDIWKKRKLEEHMNTISQRGEDPALLYSGLAVRDINTDNVVKERLQSPWSFENLTKSILKENFIGSTSAAIVKTDVLRTIEGFDENLSNRQDWDLWIRILHEDDSISFIDRILVERKISSNSISNSLTNRLLGTKQCLKKHRVKLEEYPNILAKHLNYLSKLELNYNRKDGWRTAIESLKINKIQTELLVALLLSLLGKTVYRKVFKYIHDRDSPTDIRF